MASTVSRVSRGHVDLERGGDRLQRGERRALLHALLELGD